MRHLVCHCVLALGLSLLLWSAAAAQAPARTTEKPEQIFARAVQLHQAGDLEGALREYQAFLALRPERVDARSNLGVVYARLGRFADAIEQYQRALSLDGGNQGIRFNLAVAFYKIARFVSAAKELTIVVAEQPDNKNARYLLSDCYLRTGEYTKVIESLAPFEAANPNDRALAYMLGLAYLNEKQMEKGQRLLDRILRDGDSAEAHLMIGTTHLLIGENEQARKEFQRATELNPQLPTVFSFLGQTLVRLGNTDDAQIAFRRELANNPNDFISCLQMGILLKQEQKLDEARDFFQRALTVRPNEPNARFYLASVDVGLGKIAQALPVLEALIKDAPDFVEAHVMLATVYYRLKRKADGDREQAIVNQLNAERQAKQPGAKP
ncbi:MAG: tetratricopeptide repeat protein [Acidobacteriota bacterium]